MISEQQRDPEPLQTFDWSTSSDLTHELILAVAAQAKSDPIDITPLHSAIDADALKSLFDWGETASDTDTSVIEFDYLDYRIVLESTGTGHVYDRSALETRPHVSTP